MRVITGIAKGHVLKAPRGLKTRPTTDRVKESIFNILGYIDLNANVLDIYAGSGAIGIEFLSRGAKLCYFIDYDDDSIKVTLENLKKTKLVDKSHVLKKKVFDGIKILGQKDIAFDYIFMDPPYNYDLIVPTMEKIIECEILNPDGIIICEHDAKDNIPENISIMNRIDQRKYGNTVISFYKIGEVN